MNRILWTATLFSVAVAGCLSLSNPLTDDEQNPRFAAWTEDNTTTPQIVYDGLGRSFTLNIENVQPKKTVRTPNGETKIGEAGTHPVCLETPNKTLDCEDVSLIPGQVKQVRLSTGENLTLGQYDLRVLNETIPVDVRPLPEPGDWINGTLVDLRVVSNGYNETSTEWNWTLQARYHNASTPVSVSFDLGSGVRSVPWNKTGYSEETVVSTFVRAIPEYPVEGVVKTPSDELGRVQVDEHLFRWASPADAR